MDLSLYVVIDVIAAVLLLLIGLTVLLKNTRLSINRTFFFTTLLAGFWIIANYYATFVKDNDLIGLIANRLTFFFPLMTVYNLVSFVSEWTKHRLHRRLRTALNVWTVAVALLTFSSAIVKSVSDDGSGIYEIHFGAGIGLYAITLIGLLIYLFVMLAQSRKTATELMRRQINVVTKSFAVGISILVLMIFVFPVVFRWFGFTQIGVFAVFIIIGGLMYTIAKHRLFDVKIVAIRATVYILSIATLGAVCVAVMYIIAHTFSNGAGSNESSQLALIVGVAIAGLSFHPLKVFFDKATARFFFRDAYDPQVLYDRLNRLLVSSIDTNYVMEHSISIIKNSLRLDYGSIALTGIEDSIRTFGDKIEIDSATFLLFSKAASASRRKVVVADYLDRPSQQILKERMADCNISTLVNLSQHNGDGTGKMGFIALGSKKKGTPYNEDDIRTLEAVANELLLSMQNALHFEEIQQFNVTLQDKVNDATRKLKATNEKLKRMDETKDEFISMASHQLRTPLTSVKGYVSMVLDGDVGPINEQQRELLNQSFQSSQRMSNLISDLLNLSRINTGKFVIENSPVYLPAVIETELQQLREMAQGKGVELKLTVPPVFPTLMLDDGKMHQAIMNLIDNALYYTPAGGEVDVQLIETPTAIEFRVVDTGIGVPKDAQHHLFTKMFRAENARRARPDGTGLGLFMVKKVVVEQKGSIIFETEEGKGSTFGFRFNKKDHQLDGAAAEKPEAAVTPAAA